MQDLIKEFEDTGGITEKSVKVLQSEKKARIDLRNSLKTNPNREFAIYLLKRFIELRKDPEFELWIEDLMMASYMVGIHGNVEDSLLIWEAKYADFDTYCGMDGELIAFSGLAQTINFLETNGSEDAKKAIKYLKGYNEKDIQEYFSALESIWWIA
jgi:hypothetical protein